MARVIVQADASGALRALRDLQANQLPFATALALTRTAQYVRSKLVQNQAEVFDAPTPFTQNSMYLSPATKGNLMAQVSVKDRQSKYLMPEVYGGERGLKGFESLLIRSGVMQSGWFAIPASGQKLDQYGNVPAGTVRKILSQLQSSRDYLQNESAAKKTKRNKLPVGRYFAIKNGDTSHLRPGIYERQSLTSHSQIKPIFVFTPSAPKYSKRWDFFGVGRAAALERFPIEFERAMSVATATAR